MKYTTFDFDLSKQADEEDFSFVRLPYETNSSTKVLFVLDKVPQEDLKSGKLLSGPTGDLLNALVSQARRICGSPAMPSWLAVSFTAYKTYGKDAAFRAHASEVFARRLKHLILRYKPDFVVGFGLAVMDGMIPDKIVLGNNRHSYWLGRPIPTEVTVKKTTHKTTFIGSLSLDNVVRGSTAEANMLGYMFRHLMPIFGKTFSVDSARLSKHTSHLIKDIKGFKALMNRMREADRVAIDTEAKNLNRVATTLYTVQMSDNIDEGFIVPIKHPETPFTPKELDYILASYKEYFEGANRNEYHIYANARFDLTLLRSECGIEYFHNDLWDIFAGDFALDESLVGLPGIINEGYFSLANLAVQYGFEGYLTADFSKQHRADFEHASLSDKNVLHYCTLDTCVPFAIHEQQKKRALLDKYAKYETVVTKEISDTIHAFSTMEFNGMGLDIPYLFYLKTQDSPIEQEIQKRISAILSSEGAKKANRVLGKAKGIPEGHVFGGMISQDKHTVTTLKLNKPEHKQVLFFDVLGLKPLSVGKSGAGNIDAAFQKAYAHVPEVAQFSNLEKAKKLKNAYVKSFLKKLGSDPDLQKDGRIRSSYSFYIVTHRTASKDPNLQQIPSRSALGKHIKRLFVARPGCLWIKVDYRVHEVRGWGIIASDPGVAAVFAAAKKLRDQYRLHPTPELAKRIKLEADVHIQNASYFFSVAMDAVDPALRNAVKGIIFGLIYGMGMKTLAGNIKQSVDFTKNLVTNFSKRFPKAMAWTKDIKKQAKAQLFAEAPIGIRRHLFGYLLPSSLQHASEVYARLDRQAGNAPIQGMCSKFMMTGIRVLSRLRFKELMKGTDYQLWIDNSVHDSLEAESGYSCLLRNLALVEYALTEGVKKEVASRHDFNLISGLEIDFELGATLSECDSWDFSAAKLETLVVDQLLFKRNKLNEKLDVDATLADMFSDERVEKEAPKWLRQQLANTGFKFSLTERSYIKRLSDNAKATQEKAKKLLESSDSADIQKAKSLLEEASDLSSYASELREFYRANKNT